MLHHSRNKYHSQVVWLYNQKKEHLLPESFRISIPHSTASSWRNLDFTSYSGAQFQPMQQEAFEYYELYQKHENLKRVVKTITKVWIKTSDLLLPVLRKKDQFEKLVDSMQEFIRYAPKQKVLSLFKLSKHQFAYLTNAIKEKCHVSVLNKCFKKHPNQLSQQEVEKIKHLIQHSDYASWPTASVYFKGLNEKLISCSLTTFYKYIRVLDLKRIFPKPEKNYDGCKATSPNEYFHLDTTYKKLPSGEKAAMVFVSDNFSRAILGFNLATKNGAEFVKNALIRTIETVQSLHPNIIHPSILVADGGSENHSFCISELLLKTKNPILKKVTALKDVSFSNSPIEAINKIIKRYIRHFKPQTIPELEKLLPFIINDYNTIRPHLALKGLTPMQAYTNSPKPDYSLQIASARKERTEQNKKSCCLIP